MASLPQEEFVTEVRPAGGVVVGDDGSPEAEIAIRYALHEARRRKSTLHVVRAWRITSAVRLEDTVAGYVPSIGEFEAATLDDLRRRVDRVLGDVTDVAVKIHVVYAPAAQALIAASQSADVVVVGSRGLGGFASLVLGSVADQCTRHCAGPVIVVRQCAEAARSPAGQTTRAPTEPAGDEALGRGGDRSSTGDDQRRTSRVAPRRRC
jgi:nucleotide-binding universal stress UspA family protein